MAKKKKQDTSKVVHKKLLKFIWGLFALGLLMAVGYFYALSHNWLWELPSYQELENPTNHQASEIVTIDQKVLGRYYAENRTSINYHQLPDHLVNALIATEDERFRSHSGIDVRATVRAVVYLGTAGGASTLSQQLAKMLYHDPSTRLLNRIKQKTMEWVIAVQLEKRYTKNEILAMYLNRFDFIRQAVGVESAASIYFNTNVENLTLPQAAVLVGMAKNPSLYNPISNPENAFGRRNQVYFQMVRNGYITQEDYDSLKVLPIELDYNPVSHNAGSATYFREVLRKDLTKLLNAKDEDGNYIIHKPDSAKSKYNLYTDGLKIYTTLNYSMQKYAEKAVKQHLGGELQKDFNEGLPNLKNAPFANNMTDEQVDRILTTAMKRSSRYRVMAGKECGNCHRRGKYVEVKEIDGEKVNYCNAEDCHHKGKYIPADSVEFYFKEPLETKVFSWDGTIDTLISPWDSIRYTKSFFHAGFMAMDPHTGEVRAWVGGINQKYFAYDHVKQGKRQVGSTFKPFVYAMAIENGLSPCYKVPNQRVVIKKGKYGLGEDWSPNNSDTNCLYEMVSLKYGLANSNNFISTWVMNRFGPASAVEYAKKMGITSKLDPVPSLVLGVSEISLYEMVGAYSTFANKGVYQTPIYITRIEDKNGNVIAEYVPEAQDVMSEDMAYTMVELMKGVVMGVRGCNGKTSGTGVRLHSNRPYAKVPWDRPIAGKTGTTQNHSDGWFMGMTPDLVAGVWVGAEDRGVHFKSIRLGQGANMALPIWGYFMNQVWADSSLNISTGDFEKPLDYNVQINCDESRDSGGGPDDFGL